MFIVIGDILFQSVLFKFYTLSNNVTPRDVLSNKFALKMNCLTYFTEHRVFKLPSLVSSNDFFLLIIF